MSEHGSAIERGLFLDGGWQPAADGAWEDVRSPSDGTIVGRTAVAALADLERAVSAAAGPGRIWMRTHVDERAAVLRRAADGVEDNLDAIAELLTREQGKPLPDSRKEIQFAAEVLRYYAEEGRRIHGSLRPSVRRDVKSIVSYAPLGTVGAIVPWNYPVDLYAWKVAPALAAGNPVIAKPPPDAPLAIGRFVDVLARAGLPPGALADLPGGSELGEALVGHPGVAAITATASTATGRRIAAAAAPGLKRVSLELGGQTPFIVLEDADVEEAAAAAVRRSFSNMGQICIAVNRVLVATPRHAEFRDAVVELTSQLRIGPPLDNGVEYGPVFNPEVLARTRAHIDDALSRGATLAIGGHALNQGPLFVSPAVLDGVPPSARIMNEETFGPAMAITASRSNAELLALANALPYGLAAYVYSRDLERAWAFADQLEAGGVGINVNDVTELQAPFGGWKLSGPGVDLGPEGLRGMLATKHVRARVRELNLS